MNPPAIEISGLRYVYPDGRRAIDTIDLSVDKGERVALVGANGAGKTTLLLHLNGILRGEGDIRIFGTRVEQKNLPTIRRQVGLVFQNPDDQLFCPTLYEDVAFGPRNLGLPEQDVAQRVQNALQVVGLAGQERRSSFHLSVGEKKRAALATVLSMDPPLLVLDEPSSNLDPRGRRELAALLRAMPQTMMLATHDLDFARAVCATVAVMHKGKIAVKGDIQQLLQDTCRLQEYGL